jgi:hypothetical protein
VSRWEFWTATIRPEAAPAGTTSQSRLRDVVTPVLVIAGLTVAALAPSLGAQHRLRSPSETLASTAPGLGDTSALRSVVCNSPTSCVAVGSFSPHGSGDIERGLVETWNGTAWSFAPSPSPAGDTQLESIACPSRTSCVAVGHSGPAGNPSAARAFAEVWDGSSWTVVPVPSPGIPSGFQAIDCTSALSCIAVGSSSSATNGYASALAESWDGTRWSIAVTPHAPKSYVSLLHSIVCLGPSICTAVGSYSNNFDSDNPDARTLVESWNGSTWSIVPSPNPGNGYHSVLLSITCASRTACVAVGDYSARGDFYKADEQSLMEVWGGTVWSVVAAASQGTAGQSLLNSIACASPLTCIAVGSISTGADQDAKSLAESWNGTSWTERPNPAVSGAFDSVACPTLTLCMAVGDQNTATSTSGQLVVERLAR